MLFLHNGPEIFIWKILEMYDDTIFQILFQNETIFFSPQCTRLEESFWKKFRNWVCVQLTQPDIKVSIDTTRYKCEWGVDMARSKWFAIQSNCYLNLQNNKIAEIKISWFDFFYRVKLRIYVLEY